MLIRRVQYFVSRLREIYRDYFTGRRDFDPAFFLADWENKFGDVHDPLPSEVFERIKTLMPPSVEKQKQRSICEIGAGYGRIAEYLQHSWKLILVEPDDNLHRVLSRRFPNAKIIHGNCVNVSEIDSTLFYTVRALEYSSLIELIRMFLILKKTNNILICWERRYTNRKIGIAAFLARYKRFYPQSLVN